MGDKVGRVYVDSQDLSTLQTRKFKGLKVDKRKPTDEALDSVQGVGSVEGVVQGENEGGRKRAKRD
jgi:ribosome production factor 2